MPPMLRPALLAVLPLLACATMPPPMSVPPRLRATGTFEVKPTSQTAYDTRPGAALGRTTLEKTFQGGLAARSQVEMLGAMTEVKGSAGYVAMERVEGTLEGKAGSFVLLQRGTMDRGALELLVTVVPDSATGELVGMRGVMTIDIVEGQHRYALEYWFQR
jgi:hypothetical protein